MSKLDCKHLLELLLLLFAITAHTDPSFVMLLKAVLLVKPELRIVERHLFVLYGYDTGLSPLG